MAYCRFSSDDFQCDLYVYADVGGGITIHIAKNRYVLKEPLPPPISFDDPKAWLERHNRVMKLIKPELLEPIDLPYAGESFNLEQEDAARFIEKLIALGYRAPEFLAKEVREDRLDD